MSELRIAPADLDDPAVATLILHHVAAARVNSPADSSYALDRDGLRRAGVALFAAWRGNALVGMGALKELGGDAAELKSMRTVAGAERQGVGQAMLDHLLAEARRRGLARVLLETGGNDAFAPARRLYERNGFARCAPFGDYVESDFNLCYALTL